MQQAVTEAVQSACDAVFIKLSAYLNRWILPSEPEGSGHMALSMIVLCSIWMCSGRSPWRR